MKKALVVFLALAMVVGVFADEPVADVKVSAFSGEASVKWGVDLDTGRTGFDNSAKVTFKLNLFNGGDKSATGDGAVWGEIKIKTDSDTFLGWEGNDKIASNKGMESDQKLKVVVDVAKLHIGPAYVAIKSGDTQVGEYKLITGIRAEQEKVGNVGPDGYKYGITAGYAMDGIFSVDVDFRSKPSSSGNIYTNAYALAADVALKMVPNANIKLGGAWNGFGGSTVNTEINSKYNSDNFYDTTSTIAGYVQGDYKFAIGDKFYVKPQVAFTHATVTDETPYPVTLDAYLTNAMVKDFTQYLNGEYVLDTEVKNSSKLGKYTVVTQSVNLKLDTLDAVKSALNDKGLVGNVSNPTPPVTPDKLADYWDKTARVEKYTVANTLFKLLNGKIVSTEESIGNIGGSASYYDEQINRNVNYNYGPIAYSLPSTVDFLRKDTKTDKGEFAGAVFFGWGDTEDSKAGVYLMDIDASKKRTPGVGVTYTRGLYNNTAATYEYYPIKYTKETNGTFTPLVDAYDYYIRDTKTLDYTKSVSGKNRITLSAFSGSIVPNLTAAFWFGTEFGDVETKETSEIEISPNETYIYEPKLIETTKTVKTEGYEFAIGAKYEIAVGAGKITPQFGLAMCDAKCSNALFATTDANGFGKNVTGKYVKSSLASGTDLWINPDTNVVENKKENKLVEAVGVTNLKIGAEFGGFVPNTTFGIEYTSGNLAANGVKYTTDVRTNKDTKEIENKEVGTLNITCKISL